MDLRGRRTARITTRWATDAAAAPTAHDPPAASIERDQRLCKRTGPRFPTVPWRRGRHETGSRSWPTTRSSLSGRRERIRVRALRALQLPRCLAAVSALGSGGAGVMETTHTTPRARHEKRHEQSRFFVGGHVGPVGPRDRRLIEDCLGERAKRGLRASLPELARSIALPNERGAAATRALEHHGRRVRPGGSPSFGRFPQPNCAPGGVIRLGPLSRILARCER